MAEKKLSLHDTGQASGGGMTYVLVYWLAKSIVAAIVVGVAIFAANKEGWFKVLGF